MMVVREASSFDDDGTTISVWSETLGEQKDYFVSINEVDGWLRSRNFRHAFANVFFRRAHGADEIEMIAVVQL